MKQKLIDANNIEYHKVWIETSIEGQHDGCIMAYKNQIDGLPTVDAIPVEWLENELEVLKDTVIHIPNFKPDYWLLKDEIKSLETVLGMWKEEKCGADG